MTIQKLRFAFMVGPCPKHKNECPIPPKKGRRKRPCQWGHTALEFAEHCDPCAIKFMAALKNPYSFAQRLHHSKTRSK